MHTYTTSKSQPASSIPLCCPAGQQCCTTRNTELAIDDHCYFCLLARQAWNPCKGRAKQLHTHFNQIRPSCMHQLSQQDPDRLWLCSQPKLHHDPNHYQSFFNCCAGLSVGARHREQPAIKTQDQVKHSLEGC